MSTFVALVLVASVMVTVPFTNGNVNVPQCPEGWTYEPTAERCYWFVRSPATWNAALENCEDANATLANVPNKDVGRALLMFITGQMGVVDVTGFHIGLRFNSTQGKWLWTADGSEANATYDYTEEPLPANPKEHACVEASLDTFNWGRWYPIVCEDAYGQAVKPAVCERQAIQQLKNAKAKKEKVGSLSKKSKNGQKSGRGGRKQKSGVKSVSAVVNVK